MTSRHFLRDDDLSPDAQRRVLALAAAMKRDPLGHRPLDGPRSVAVVFDKPSTRTRVSFAVGIAELGGYPLVIDSGTTQAGRGEPVADTARVLGRQVDAIVWRTGAHEGLEVMAGHAGVPVVNALSDAFHPCQVLADLMTVQEHRGGGLRGATVAFVGDIANNMAASWAVGGAMAGVHVRLAGPASARPSSATITAALAAGRATGGSVAVLDDAKAAAYGADVLVTDTWSSMGAGGSGATDAELAPFRIDGGLLDVAGPDALVLHCLPAYRGKEISAEVLDGDHPEIWDAAENRKHVQKAVLAHLLAAA